ncbi:MAG: hypothetical protein LBQ66_02005 [Planctomycetaceae bacterium]|nr:hypothetical protein [Planctomycetaceae bacterium]
MSVYYGFTHDLKLPLTIEKLYAVYSITYGGFPFHGNGNASLFLIIDDNQYPNFLPALLFDIVCPHLYGQDWCFQPLNGEFLPTAILGYDTFTNDASYFEKFILQDLDAHKTFERWKISIDNSMKQATCSCNIELAPTIVMHPSYKT